MLPAFRRLVRSLTIGAACLFPVLAQASAPGVLASEQTRYIATQFPGRMAGSPAEMLSAEYLRQKFASWGYQSDIRTFKGRYIYTARSGTTNWHNYTGSMVLAAHEGQEPQQIIVMAHLDTYTPLNDKDTDQNLGGLTLQGVDDNAAGIGVMLELAERLKTVKTTYGIRFIASSAEEVGMSGAQNILRRMSPQERKNTLLVINLDNLIVGQKLWFNSGVSTPASIRKLTRDKALSIARTKGIAAGTNPGHNPRYPAGTGCCNDAEPFDKAGIPVLSVESLDWQNGLKNGTQYPVSRAFPQGSNIHNINLDNQQYLDKHLPGRIEKRSRDTVRILLPLIQDLAKARS
ncbi:aminopeptidase [Shimwellia blattae]|uniref:Alkaline phosphatase isozyme conversion n=1 Tax=Shimwellia blattae (strain ATCC 29907 / DSM 4481 / JCM 1650 / NBRC 105725 / CDC 9005-74) TaxID=630626 RepID=I2B627_SHIBC|nr:aminopeptidase [Shimwellia blattae]AFJ45981.1 alkaline phosphatase isozyme conversion [Shimwellia blattae DSM 4481 = NBRC 105725]GAB81736.1 alkaline phosphatase isozyme conversion protein [Shimwellia blattae DSM 4481 = NBRC 105725]VDY63457.1 Arginyl aminopeptidase [Shimwellia blattae]VEC21369.1 Arginyl aminopeptidase [Shimwellia blattae]